MTNPGTTIKVSIADIQLNPRSFIANLFGIMDESAEIAVLDKLIAEPGDITFVQAKSTTGDHFFEFAPSAVDALEGEDKDGKVIVVDITIGRDASFSGLIDLFYNGVECISEQTDEDPKTFRPIIDGDAPCRILQIVQRRDKSRTGIGWKVSVGTLL